MSNARLLMMMTHRAINLRSPFISSFLSHLCFRGIVKCLKFHLLDRFVTLSSPMYQSAVKNSAVANFSANHIDLGINNNHGTEAHRIFAWYWKRDYHSINAVHDDIFHPYTPCLVKVFANSVVLPTTSQNFTPFRNFVAVNPLPWPLFVEGFRSSRLWFTSQLISPSGQQLHHSSGVCSQIQGWQCDAYMGAVEEMVCVVCVLQRMNSGDGCDLASTLCKYDLRNWDLFVLRWTRVRRVRRGSLSSEQLMCGGGVCSILLLSLVARCQVTIDVCTWRMFVCLL